MRFCISQLRDASDAEDITSEVFTRAYAAYRDDMLDFAHVRPWLYRVARNEVIDFTRRRTTRHRLAWRLHRQPATVEDAEAVATHRGDLRHILEVQQQLKRRDREIIGLRYAAELSYREIAELLDMTEAAAMVAAGRALTRARKLVEEGR